MGHHFGWDEFTFLLSGLQWTILLTLIAFFGGCSAGLVVALARTSGNAVLERVTRIYIGVFQGTPLLMQLFVVYYGLGLIGLKLSAFTAVAIGFTFNASAFLGEIWRGSILPQAFRISLPATIGYLVQLIKGTSLAAIVGFIELARAGQIVSNQTYQPLLVFGVVGVIYFFLCWPLSLWGSHMENKLAVASR